MDLSLVEVVEKLAAGGFVTFLIVILLAGKYRVWVWGSHLDDVVREKNAQIEYERQLRAEMRQMLLDQKDLMGRSVSVASKALGKP